MGLSCLFIIWDDYRHSFCSLNSPSSTKSLLLGASCIRKGVVNIALEQDETGEDYPTPPPLPKVSHFPVESLCAPLRGAQPLVR